MKLNAGDFVLLIKPDGKTCLGYATGLAEGKTCEIKMILEEDRFPIPNISEVFDGTAAFYFFKSAIEAYLEVALKHKDLTEKLNKS